jgi:hypothetical protein
MRDVHPSARSGRRHYHWWRAYHGLPEHSKWRSVAREANVPVSVVVHIALCLLDLASRSDPRGSISTFKAFDCAGIVDVPVPDVERVVTVLRKIHWIDDHMLAEWDERQPLREEENAAARKADYRSRLRDSGGTSRDIGGTLRDKVGQQPMSRHVTRLPSQDRDKDTNTTSSFGAAREKQNPPARSFAGASEPRSGTAAKRPSDVTRQELDELLERKRTGVPHAPKQ